VLGEAGSGEAGAAREPGPPAWEALELEAQNALFERRGGPAEAIVTWVCERYRPEVVLACSFGVEDCVLVDMCWRLGAGIQAFYLDTQLLFPETYATRDRLVARYGLRPAQVLPALSPDEQAERFGPELWSRDPDLCCEMRKVRPLQAYLRGRRAWITGVRREQAPTRARAPFVGWDARFGLVKANPLAAWTAREVWAYVHEHDVPYCALHDRGYPSIGCWPCTRAVRPGEDPRAGRWAGLDKTECGLHA
jgi:phosphoadenosine phosphosulfate reductase